MHYANSEQLDSVKVRVVMGAWQGHPRTRKRALAMGAGERTKDFGYLKLLANYRPARAGR